MFPTRLGCLGLADFLGAVEVRLRILLLLVHGEVTVDMLIEPALGLRLAVNLASLLGLDVLGIG